MRARPARLGEGAAQRGHARRMTRLARWLGPARRIRVWRGRRLEHGVDAAPVRARRR